MLSDLGLGHRVIALPGMRLRVGDAGLTDMDMRNVAHGGTFLGFARLSYSLLVNTVADSGFNVMKSFGNPRIHYGA